MTDNESSFAYSTQAEFKPSKTWLIQLIFTPNLHQQS